MAHTHTMNCSLECPAAVKAKKAKRSPRTYGYLRDMLEGAILRLEGAEGYAIGDPLLGNVLGHVRGSLRQARAALECRQP